MEATNRRMRKTVTIKNVLFVPGLGTNLFSIGAATLAGIEAVFTNSEVFFYQHGTLKLSGGRNRNILYKLNVKTRTHQWSAALMARPLPSLDTWRQRLAHANTHIITSIGSKKLVDGLDLAEHTKPQPQKPCKGCIFGKMKRKPFKTERTRGNHVGALVHADVCGPMQRASLLGAYYFLLIKDDFSGWMTVDFLKPKCEVADLIHRYATRMKIKTGRTVETLRADNGGEFFLTEVLAPQNRLPT